MDERKFFPKSERLYLQNDISLLFDKGHSFVSYPLRIVYMPDANSNASGAPISMLVSVPKKRIRHAVRRNRIKRLIRESFRLNKSETSVLLRNNGKHLHIAFLYICNELMTYSNIEKAVLKALRIIMIRIIKDEKGL